MNRKIIENTLTTIKIIIFLKSKFYNLIHYYLYGKFRYPI